MLDRALEISLDKLTHVALWNGGVGDRPGGTEDMVQRARDRVATIVHLDSRQVLV